MAEKRFYTPNTKVVTVKAPVAEKPAEAVVDMVDIERILPDGRIIRRQCNRPDLVVFERQGFKLVGQKTE